MGKGLFQYQRAVKFKVVLYNEWPLNFSVPNQNPFVSAEPDKMIEIFLNRFNLHC